MLLTVDVGNTQTHIGCFDGPDLAADWRFATRADSTADELAVNLQGSLRLAGIELPELRRAIVSTVVPRLGREYERLCERHLRSPCLLVGPALKTGMPILIDNPHELGSDRLVNAVAAFERIGGACVSVDFGTSINFDAVSGAGEYLGGVIGPGLEISIEGPRRTRREAAPDRHRRTGCRNRPQHADRPAVGLRLRLRGAGRRDLPPAARRARGRHGDRHRRIGELGGATLRDGRRDRSVAHPAGALADRGAQPMSADESRRTANLAAQPGGEPRSGASSTQPPLSAPFLIGEVELSNRVMLAPLAGIGNWFVRLQARRHGAGLAVSEMVSSHAIHYRNERTMRDLLRIHPDEHPVSLQLFGSDPAIMREAAAIASAGRRRPDRPEHGLPGKEGLQDRRRRRPDR